MKKVYVLFDGNNLFYRCFFASKGNQSQAFRIFYGYLAKIKKKFCKIESTSFETIFVFFWDSPRNWRRTLSRIYKETRREQRKDQKSFYDRLYFSMDLIKTKLDYPQYQIENYEVDDIISLYIRTLTERSKSRKNFLIVSNDKDYMQLLEKSKEKVVIQLKISKKRWTYLTYDKFKKTYGIEPKAYAGILALMGDASDNVKGVPGIGEKKALKAIQENGDIRDWLFDPINNAEGLKRICLKHKSTIQKDLMLVDLENSKIFEHEKLELKGEA